MLVDNSKHQTTHNQPLQHQLPRESLVGRQLIVENLPDNVGWKELKDLMRQAGNVVRVNIMSSPSCTTTTTTNSNNNSCGGGSSNSSLNNLVNESHAVVLFSNAKDAQQAILSFAGYHWLGKKLNVKLDKSLGEKLKISSEPDTLHLNSSNSSGNLPSTHNSTTVNSIADSSVSPSNACQDGVVKDQSKTQIYVFNLPYIVGWQDLKDLFREAGPVLRSDIKQDQKTGKSKGMGTVIFTNAKSAQIAVELFDGFEWFGRKIEVKIDKHQSNHGHNQQQQPSETTTGVNRKTSISSDTIFLPDESNTAASQEHPQPESNAFSWADKVKLAHEQKPNSSSAAASTKQVDACSIWKTKAEVMELSKSFIGTSINDPSSFSPYRPKSKPAQIPISQISKSNPIGSPLSTSQQHDILGPGLNMEDALGSLSSFVYDHNSSGSGGRPRNGSFSGNSRPMSLGLISSSLPSSRNIWATLHSTTGNRILGTSPLDNCSTSSNNNNSNNNTIINAGSCGSGGGDTLFASGNWTPANSLNNSTFHTGNNTARWPPISSTSTSNNNGSSNIIGKGRRSNSVRSEDGRLFF